MKKTTELLQKINAKRNEVVQLKADNKLDEALKAANELTQLKNDYAVEKALEDTTAVGNNEPISTAKKLDKMTMRRAFNKKLFEMSAVNLGSLTEEEAQFANKLKMDVGAGQVGATAAKGGYLIPQEFLTPIAEARKEYIALKDLCTVKLVNRLTGVMPKASAEDGKLVKFDENSAINQSSIDFGQVSYSVESYGDLIPVSNELISDADVDVIGFINQRFAKKAINTENAAIIAKLDTATTTAITDYKGILTALNVSLDPAIAADAVIITNQDGFNYLDSLEDKEGRPLLTVSYADFKTRLFRGHKVVYLSNTAIPTNSKKIPFYVGSLFDFAYFFDRAGVELAADSSAGFTTNTTYLRAIERYDVKTVNEKAVVKLELTVAEA